jgi:hypothetical protein
MLARFLAPVARKRSRPAQHRVRLDDAQDPENRREPGTKLDEKQAITVRQQNVTAPTTQVGHRARKCAKYDQLRAGREAGRAQRPASAFLRKAAGQERKLSADVALLLHRANDRLGWAYLMSP